MASQAEIDYWLTDSAGWRFHVHGGRADALIREIAALTPPDELIRLIKELRMHADLEVQLTRLAEARRADAQARGWELP